MQVNVDLDQLERLSFQMTPIIGFFGGRKFEHKSGSYSINDLYKPLSQFVRPNEEQAEKIIRILRRLQKCEKKADKLLAESNIFIKAITALKSWIGSQRFDRKSTISKIEDTALPILANLYERKAVEKAHEHAIKPLAQAIDEMGLPHIIGEKVVKHLAERPKISTYPHYQKEPYTILTLSEDQTYLIFKKKLNAAKVGSGYQATIVHAIDLKTRERKVYYRTPLKDQDSKLFHESEMAARKRIRDIPGVLHFDAVYIYTSSKGYEKRGAIAPYYEKGDLLNTLNQSMDVKQRIMRILLQTLTLIHQRNVNHRDIKPENILLTDDYKPVIADLGFATLNEPSSKAYYYCAGTPSYSSPELKTEGKKGLHNDVWSLGITFFAFMKGSFPKPHDIQNLDETCPFQKATKRMLTLSHLERPEIHAIEI